MPLHLQLKPNIISPYLSVQESASRPKSRGEVHTDAAGSAAYMPAFSDEEETEESAGEGGGRKGVGSSEQQGADVPPSALAAATEIAAAAATTPQAQTAHAATTPTAPTAAAEEAGHTAPTPALTTAVKAADSQVNAATPSGDFFMYQAGDGQWVYMDPLNLKCLLFHYGSYEACPPQITARVLEIESIEQTESTRRCGVELTRTRTMKHTHIHAHSNRTNTHTTHDHTHARPHTCNRYKRTQHTTHSQTRAFLVSPSTRQYFLAR